MRRVLREEMEQVHERIDRIKNARMEQPQNAPNVRKRQRVQPREVRVKDEEYYGGGFDEEDDRDSIVSNRRYDGRFREARNREDNQLGSIKMKIPSFQGKNDPEAYLEQEKKKIELVFDCHNYSELKKVKLAAIEKFQLYNYLVGSTNIKQEKKQKVSNRNVGGDEIHDKESLFQAIVLYQKLQSLTQGNQSVEDY